MAGGPSPQQNGIIEGINVTPLVDIMLVLLVIFLVTAKVVMQPAVGVELPKASTSEQTQVVFSVTVLIDGTRKINDDIFSDDASFIARVREQLTTNPSLNVVIQANRDVSYELVVHTIDLLRQAGVERFAFAVAEATTP